MSEAANQWNVEGIPAAQQVQLPQIISLDRFLIEKLDSPPELVNGLIHRETTTMFCGGSKSCKTFLQMDLGLSVSQGRSWLGRQVTKGRVLYVNFELSAYFCQKRLKVLAGVKSLEMPTPDFDVWNLRGHAADVRDIVPRIIERCKDGDYSMIILDPIYKLMGGRSENAANDMADFLNHFEALSAETGAAVVYSHHFAKGAAGNKDQIDRASGSGVFARHADGIITLTAHEEQDAFTFEATLRNFPPLEPLVLRWEYPLMVPDYDADPKKLKSRAGAKAIYSVVQLLECLTDGMTTGDWKAATVARLGLAPSTFAKMKAQAVIEGRVEPKGKGWFRKEKTRRVEMKVAA